MFVHQQDRQGSLTPKTAPGLYLSPINMPLSLADDDKSRGEDGKTGDRSVPEDDSARKAPRTEKTISETFEDLSAEEKETLNHLLDRMTGRKK